MPGQTGYNQDLYQDAYGHTIPMAGPAMAAGGVATVAAVGTITVVTAGAGVGSSIGFAAGQSAQDMAGTFQLTTAGTPAAGIIAVVTFNNPLPAIPKSIQCTLNRTDISQNEVPLVSAITVNGFTLSTALTMVTAKLFNISYVVVA